MREDSEPRVSDAEWAAARPVFSQLTGAADISYQPEFHPTYEKAYVFLAEPERLEAFSALEGASSGKGEDEAHAENPPDGKSVQSGAGDTTTTTSTRGAVAVPVVEGNEHAVSMPVHANSVEQAPNVIDLSGDEEESDGVDL